MLSHVLLVDDDPLICQSYQRQLAGQFRLEVAHSGKEGLQRLECDGVYPVVVADVMMPQMNGIQFLSRVRQLSPQTTRIALTGSDEPGDMARAVNEGEVFRFLTKPCPASKLAEALTAGLRHYHLVVAEKELLSRTLTGALGLVNEVLSLVNPTAFGRTGRIQQIARQLAEHEGISDTWKISVAATLSQAGCVTVPEHILQKVQKRQPLTAAEEEAFRHHPEVGKSLVERIPRLEEVAELVALQQADYFDIIGTPNFAIPTGARILRVAIDYALLSAGGLSDTAAVQELRRRRRCYDPAILDSLEQVLGVAGSKADPARVSIDELEEGMVFTANVLDVDGSVLVTCGQAVTRLLLKRLVQYNVMSRPLKQPLDVQIPRRSRIAGRQQLSAAVQ